MKKIFHNILFLIATHQAVAQDPHWSQPLSTLPYQNPAFTGLHSRFSAGMNYRNQWSALNTAYKSFLLNAEYRFGKDEPKGAAISLGFVYLNDVAGDGRYKTAGGGLTMSCLLKTGSRTRLGFGIGFNRIRNSIQTENFTWASQFDGREYNAAWASGEAETFDQASYSDLNGGISFAIDERKRTRGFQKSAKWFMGYSLHHINSPELGITGGTQKLHMKHAGFISGHIPLKYNYSFLPIAIYYQQGPMLEATVGGLVRYSLGEQSRITGIRKASAFMFGALFRWQDALVPIVQLEKSGFVYGISYDLNVSKLSNVSNLRGGFEISIKYNTISYLYNEKPRSTR